MVAFGRRDRQVTAASRARSTLRRASARLAPVRPVALVTEPPFPYIDVRVRVAAVNLNIDVRLRRGRCRLQEPRREPGKGRTPGAGWRWPCWARRSSC